MAPRRPVRLQLALVGLAAAIGAIAAGEQSRAPASVTIQLLAINDFHGNLEPPDGSNGFIRRTPAGGAEYLATHLGAHIAKNPNSIVVAAGDLIGATPLVSALFHDEPAIEAMNAMRLAVSAVGNHEFDHGAAELLRMQTGGCHPVAGCADGDGFSGASFQYLAANVVRQSGADSEPLLPPTAVKTIAGVKIGFIGETLRSTPRIVTPTGVRGLTFLDEAETANTYAAALKQQGVRTIVLLIHEGGEQGGGGDPNGCNGFIGAIRGIVEKLSPDIKIVISGHTHQAYNCTIGGRLVTSASSFGRVITRIEVDIDPSNDAVVAASATNEIVSRDVEKNSVQTRLIEKYSARSSSIAKRIVGSTAGDIRRAPNRSGESALGDVIADAQLAATSQPDKGRAVVAFMNPGGIRADIAAGASGGERPGQVNYAQLFAVQPFNNVLTVLTLTGEMMKRLLEQQFGGARADAALILQVSNGFTYRYRLTAPPGQHVEAASIMIGGRVIGPADRVRVATNSFLAAGGDGFTVFQEGSDQLGGDIDVDALASYFRSRSPVVPGPQNRIIRID